MSRHHTTTHRRTLTGATAATAGFLALITVGCGVPNASTATRPTAGIGTSGASWTAATPSPTFKPGAFPAWNVENRENPWTVTPPDIAAGVEAKLDPGVPQQAFEAVVALTEQYLYVSAYAGVDPLPKDVLDEISTHLTEQAKQGFDASAKVVERSDAHSDKDYGNVAVFIADNHFSGGSQYRVVNDSVYGHRTIHDTRLSLDKYGEIEMTFTASTNLYYQCQGQPYTSTLTTRDKVVPVQNGGAWMIRWASGKWLWKPDPKVRTMTHYPCVTASSARPTP